MHLQWRPTAIDQPVSVMGAHHESRCDATFWSATITMRRSVSRARSSNAATAAWIIAGGVEHVAERMASFESINVDDIVARTITVDQSTALRSIELLADVRAAIA